MDAIAGSALLICYCVSIAGAVELCLAIERRNKKEKRRKLFGLPPGEDSWP